MLQELIEGATRMLGAMLLMMINLDGVAINI
jgi:hypothetical protein